MLQSIYASKLYKTSTRKSRIKAAAENPLNLELVSQLAKSLDDEYKTEDYLLTEEDKAVKAQPDAAGQGQGSEGGAPAGPEGGSDGGFSGGAGGFSGGGNHFSGGGDFSGGEVDSDLGDMSDDAGGAESGGAPEEPADTSSDSSSDVEESTKVKGKKVTASSDVIVEFKDMGQVAEQIKGLLNFKDSTSGVSRTSVKENELWIYYNDDVNLNNIMAIVIDTLNGSGYTYLEFNRLARSDNAIVFEIAFRSSDNQVRPKEGVEEIQPEGESIPVVEE